MIETMTGHAVGAPVDRIDGRLKVTGGAKYPGDRTLPGMLHGYLLQSTIAKGHIARIDAGRAERAAGVVGVFTHENLPKFARMPALATPGVGGIGGGCGQYPGLLQDDGVYHNGQHVALVVARTWEQASWAAHLISIDYEKSPFETGLKRSLAGAYAPTRVRGGTPDYSRGDFERALFRGGRKD